jgi:hypothetical protein
VSVRLTPSGSDFLKAVQVEMVDLGQFDVRYHFTRPPRVIVKQITGIQDAPGQVGQAKIADYDGGLDFSGSQLSPAAQQCFSAATDFHGTAIYRRYDDGWRFESFTVPKIGAAS